MKMAFMYTYNAKKYGWWKDITLLVWGPSSKLLTEDKDLQDYIKKIKDEGIYVEACKGCADLYAIADQLTAMGITVRYTGDVLTNYIKEGRHVLTL
ncbi:DsrE family protein [bacterium]|nr:DsrE family protein [bacterium]